MFLPPLNRCVARPIAMAVMGVEEPWEASVPVGKPTLAQKAKAVRIMAGAHGLVLVRHPMAVRLGAWHSRPSDSTLAVPARTRRYLFFRLLLADLSNSRAHWARRDTSSRRVSAGCSAFPRPHSRRVVCAHRALVFERPAHADRPVLGRHGRIATAACEYLAPAECC
jgi:hypothetical protein